uniref:hypothetical protein n=1 Tax=Agathobacter sp. TaxID=2021311 RepID=UPI00405617D3
MTLVMRVFGYVHKERVVMVQDLEYTEFANKNIEMCEEKLYQENSIDVYALLAEGKLEMEDVLWYQAYETFSHLCEVPLKNEQAAAEIRRYIFKNLLGGREESYIVKEENGLQITKINYCIDESTYSSLTDSELIEKMAGVLQACYKERNIFIDEGVADEIPITPSKLKKVLLYASIERRSMIRLGFAMGMDKMQLNKLLAGGAFFRELSVAVPFELIVLYCIENDCKDWRLVNKLKRTANAYCREAREFQKKKNKEKYMHTKESEVKWAAKLSGMDIEQFKKTILKPCCEAAVQKEDSVQKQYSKSAYDMIAKKSILRDRHVANATARPSYETPYLKNTVVRYAGTFGITEEYGLPIKMKSDSAFIMSQDLYCRFLSYRIMVPNPTRSRSTRLYKMEHGMLSKEVTQNVLKYSEIIHMPDLQHRIDRYDVLIALFFHFLMQRWRDSESSFLAKSQKDADNLWKIFFKEANADLKAIGYATLSSKNSLDALLRFACKSMSPLECYARVYELNVLSSLYHDSAGYNEKDYPPRERIQKAVGGILHSYERMAKLDMGLEERRKEVFEFCDRISSKIK